MLPLDSASPWCHALFTVKKVFGVRDLLWARSSGRRLCRLDSFAVKASRMAASMTLYGSAERWSARRENSTSTRFRSSLMLVHWTVVGKELSCMFLHDSCNPSNCYKEVLVLLHMVCVHNGNSVLPVCYAESIIPLQRRSLANYPRQPSPSLQICWFSKRLKAMQRTSHRPAEGEVDAGELRQREL